MHKQQTLLHSCSQQNRTIRTLHPKHLDFYVNVGAKRQRASPSTSGPREMMSESRLWLCRGLDQGAKPEPLWWSCVRVCVYVWVSECVSEQGLIT